MSNVFDSQNSLERLATLKNADLPTAVSELWKADTNFPAGDGSDPQTVLMNTLIDEAARIRQLLTENTRIQTTPFLEFTSKIGRVFDDALHSTGPRYEDIQTLEGIFADYRRSEDAFAPLADSVRCVSGPWGKFIYCVAGKNEFFATADGSAERAFVHIDQWSREGVEAAHEELERLEFIPSAFGAC